MTLHGNSTLAGDTAGLHVCEGVRSWPLRLFLFCSMTSGRAVQVESRQSLLPMDWYCRFKGTKILMMPFCLFVFLTSSFLLMWISLCCTFAKMHRINKFSHNIADNLDVMRLTWKSHGVQMFGGKTCVSFGFPPILRHCWACITHTVETGFYHFKVNQRLGHDMQQWPERKFLSIIYESI